MPFYKKKGWASNKKSGWVSKKKYGGRKTTYTKKKTYAKKTSSGNYKRRTYAPKAKSVVFAGTETANLLKTKMKMKWVQQCNVSILAGRTHTLDGTFKIRANSIKAPNYIQGGTSATGWPMMNSLYNYYMVTAAKIDVQFTMNGLPAGHLDCNAQLAFYIKLRESPPDLDVAGSFDTLTMNGNAVWKIFPAPTPSESVSHTLTGWYIPQRLYGPEADPRTANWDKYGALMGGSPVPNGNPCMWQIGCWQTNNAALQGDVPVNAMVTVTYWPIFTSPKDTTQGFRSDEGMLVMGEQLIADGARLLMEEQHGGQHDADDDDLDQITGKLEEHAIMSPTLREMLGEPKGETRVTLAKK